jgi:DNA-binding CsgD family transcriptional regulator
MESLSASRLRRVLHAVSEAVEFRELAEFRSGALALARELVPCESASYNEVKPGSSAIVVADPAAALTPDSLEIFGRFAAENPLIDHYMRTGDGQPVRFSDFISRRQLRRLTLYDHIYRPLGIEHQIAFVLPAAPGEVVGIALNRGHDDFSGEEAAMLDILRAPLRACYRRLVEREQLINRLAGYEADGAFAAQARALGLSERQAEVMLAVAGGASNTEVGTGLAISRRTVEKHLQNIYTHLNVTSRTQAIGRLRAGGRAS